MPCFGTWGMAGGGFWWLVPLVGLVFMAVMAFVCFRGFGCMGRRRPTASELSDSQHEVEGLKEDVRNLQRQPS
ncbi:MAG TPA: hypothetical protein VFF02_04425 [Anaeromyxobacteraceae bacterium]|nr:hypothetical protein [Anaeromyxobacteraceae bacterium]